MGPSKSQSAEDDLLVYKTSLASNEINVNSCSFTILSRTQGCIRSIRSGVKGSTGNMVVGYIINEVS